MKSFFDFNSWTEATRGARRWSWIVEKAEVDLDRHYLSRHISVVCPVSMFPRMNVLNVSD